MKIVRSAKQHTVFYMKKFFQFFYVAFYAFYIVIYLSTNKIKC